MGCIQQILTRRAATRNALGPLLSRGCRIPGRRGFREWPLRLFASIFPVEIWRRRSTTIICGGFPEWLRIRNPWATRGEFISHGEFVLAPNAFQGVARDPFVGANTGPESTAIDVSCAAAIFHSPSCLTKTNSKSVLLLEDASMA
jgi:hypothetical protein